MEDNILYTAVVEEIEEGVTPVVNLLHHLSIFEFQLSKDAAVTDVAIGYVNVTAADKVFGNVLQIAADGTVGSESTFSNSVTVDLNYTDGEGTDPAQNKLTNTPVVRMPVWWDQSEDNTTFTFNVSTPTGAKFSKPLSNTLKGQEGKTKVIPIVLNTDPTPMTEGWNGTDMEDPVTVSTRNIQVWNGRQLKWGCQPG